MCNHLRSLIFAIIIIIMHYAFSMLNRPPLNSLACLLFRISLLVWKLRIDHRSLACRVLSHMFLPFCGAIVVVWCYRLWSFHRRRCPVFVWTNINNDGGGAAATQHYWPAGGFFYVVSEKGVAMLPFFAHSFLVRPSNNEFFVPKANC
jgi:hypothetical protein